MATFILDSLVLSSVNVRTDVAEATLGTSVKANARFSGKRNSMRHPLPGGSLPQPRERFAYPVGYPMAGQTPLAGWCRS